MSASRTEAKRRGWVEAAPGYWARDCWRMQRMTRGWHWWYVIVAKMPGLEHGGKNGTTRTMLEAMNEMEAA